MKTSTLIAALALTLAGTAFAQEATYEYPQAAVSQLTRAEVTAQVMQARADGTLRQNELQRQQYAPFVASLSRDEVRAQTLAAAANGELLAASRESSGFEGPVGAQRSSVRTFIASK